MEKGLFTLANGFSLAEGDTQQGSSALRLVDFRHDIRARGHAVVQFEPIISALLEGCLET